MATDVNAAKKSRIAVTISKDAMAASILLRAPLDGCDPVTFDEVMDSLKAADVVFGVNEDAIRQAVDAKTYNVPIQIAAGRLPTRGSHSAFTYHFDTSDKHKPKEGEDGHIDYKDINFIQNTEKGAVLVTKTPPTMGVPGISVRGKEIKGPDGRDLPYNHGVNTGPSADGLTLVATASGVIQYQFGKVSVMDVMVLKGDIDHSVGNIDCRGSLRVSGGIKAGYKVVVDGDLEVGGSVEDADIRVKGNVMIKGGFFGEGGGVLHAGGDITIKFAEGQRIIAGRELQVGGEIVNCRVEAGERVVVKGRRGKIVGGTVRARREIRAAVLGSEAGTATELQVAFEPGLIARYHGVIKEMQRINDDQGRVKEALYMLYRLQMEGRLPPQKQAALEKLEQFQKETPENLASLAAQKAEIEAELQKHQDAQIICEEIIYPGVKASFGIVYREIVQEQKRCKLTLDGGKVMISEFRGN